MTNQDKLDYDKLIRVCNSLDANWYKSGPYINLDIYRRASDEATRILSLDYDHKMNIVLSTMFNNEPILAKYQKKDIVVL